MTSVQWWHWNDLLAYLFYVWLPLGLAYASYLVWIKESARKSRVFFAVSLIIIGLAEGSPIDDLSAYLLSVHMSQHLLFFLAAPAFFLLGLPIAEVKPLLNRFKPIVNLLTAPVSGALLSAGVLIGWHIPVVFNFALHHEIIHFFEHVTLFAAGLLFWWPILSPFEEYPKLSYPMQCIYLFLARLPQIPLAVFLTLAKDPVYDYASAPRLWSISAATDQTLGGLIMWVPIDFLFLGLIGVIFFTWYEQSEKEPEKDAS